MGGAKVVLDRSNLGIYYPHNSGNLSRKDPKKFIEGLDKNKRYIYNKFPLESVRLWIELPKFYDVNKVMLEKNIWEWERQNV